MSSNNTLQGSLADECVERLQKEWTSPIYAFFEPTPCIIETDGRRAHDFKCTRRGCKSTIQRYLDKKDATSTSNLRKHSKKCWGTELVVAADDAKSADEVRKKIVGGTLWDGTITASFEQKVSQGKVTYSHRQHTRAETRYVVHRNFNDVC